MLTNSRIFGLLLWLAAANAHIAAWHKGMYCLNGNEEGVINGNSNAAVQPLYELPKELWWMHNNNNCTNFPPARGDVLELPAGGSFRVEMAVNQYFTTLTPHGQLSAWPDGMDYPDDYNVPTCIVEPNLHTNNESTAAGSVFAISYHPNIQDVTAESLVVFTVKYHTPFKRIATYQVPAEMPACPPDGCICAWGWIPKGCGQPNMYQLPYRCNVTNATGTNPVGVGQAPVWCEEDPTQCVQGPKQMLYWNQLTGDNIKVDGYDLGGSPKSPQYNAVCGFPDGPQNDIFVPPNSDKVNRAASTETNGKNRLVVDDKTIAQTPDANTGSVQDIASHKRALGSSARLGKRYW